MGLFDTIILSEKYQCKCGAEIYDFQTKTLGKYLNTYKVGDFVSSVVYSGLVVEKIYCANCREEKEVWIVIKNNLLYGIYFMLNEAEIANRQELDRLCLLDYYRKCCNKLCEAEAKYYNLLSIIENYSEYKKNGKTIYEGLAVLNSDFKDMDYQEFLDMIINKK